MCTASPGEGLPKGHRGRQAHLQAHHWSLTPTVHRDHLSNKKVGLIGVRSVLSGAKVEGPSGGWVRLLGQRKHQVRVGRLQQKEGCVRNTDWPAKGRQGSFRTTRAQVQRGREAQRKAGSALKMMRGGSGYSPLGMRPPFSLPFPFLSLLFLPSLALAAFY